MQCVNGSASWTSLTDQLDGPAGRTSWTDQLDRPAGWTSSTDQLDRPVLFIWSRGQFAYSKIDVSVCALSQLPSPMKALFFNFYLFFDFLDLLLFSYFSPRIHLTALPRFISISSVSVLCNTTQDKSGILLMCSIYIYILPSSASTQLNSTLTQITAEVSLIFSWSSHPPTRPEK